MIRISSGITIHENEIQLDFIRSSGPGGQNVNKVASAVQLRFDVLNSSLRPEIQNRLAKLAGKRMTRDGLLIIKAARFRTQERNRQDAIERLVELIRQALMKPVARVKTLPSRSSVERQKAAKRHRGQVKKLRRSPTVTEFE
jgi:ribosome-associated protein